MEGQNKDTDVESSRDGGKQGGARQPRNSSATRQRGKRHAEVSMVTINGKLVPEPYTPKCWRCKDRNVDCVKDLYSSSCHDCNK